MKKSDMAVLILVVGMSLIISYFAGQYVMKNFAKSGVAKVEQVEKIESEHTEPSEDIFNDQAINPTVSVSVSGSNDTKPIGGQ